MALVREFISKSPEDVCHVLGVTTDGMTGKEAADRLLRFGPNTIKPEEKIEALRLLIKQFKSPIILILLVATGLSLYLGQVIDATIIFAIVALSGFLGFWQEYGANRAVEKLLATLRIGVTVLRDKKEADLPVSEIVPGDIVVLHAGDVVPADALVVESDSLFVNESVLTGEPYPVKKTAGTVGPDTPLGAHANSLLMGTHVVSGTARALVFCTGKTTQLGQAAGCLSRPMPQTEFERGIRKFGYLLTVVTVALVLLIFAVNIFFNKPVLDTFIFSLALAVGLTPQLLPVIISVNLSRGAKAMGAGKVIVKRLSAIENVGSMNILCMDKTGTLTDGVIRVKETSDAFATHSDKIFLYAYLNASFETGVLNPIDEAILSHGMPDISAFRKLDEVPYDFSRKRLSIMVAQKNAAGERHLIITKGAFDNVLAVCNRVELADGSFAPLKEHEDEIREKYKKYSAGGYRTLGLAYRDMGDEPYFDRSHESEMVFLGFITLYDSAKEGIEQTVRDLKRLGVSLKIITGDNRYLTESVMRQVGFTNFRVMTGGELQKIIHDMGDMELIRRVKQTTVFAEIEPNQKEAIVVALKKAGNVVGYLGDGINDVCALHAADIGISVEGAVDVAKEAADIVLLQKDLRMLRHGLLVARTAFANTMKYVFMATSANLGNMVSIACAALFLPFLPLLSKQVLLTNLLADLNEMTIASDQVDPEAIDGPKRWNMVFIRKSMLTFGLVSAIFDLITFGMLILIAQATETSFRTGWFTESVISACLIMLVIRSRRVFYKSRPSKPLLFTTLAVIFATLLLPYLPFAGLLGFSPLPLTVLGLIALIVVLYVITAEVVKKIFYGMQPGWYKPLLPFSLARSPHPNRGLRTRQSPKPQAQRPFRPRPGTVPGKDHGR